MFWYVSRPVGKRVRCHSFNNSPLDQQLGAKRPFVVNPNASRGAGGHTIAPPPPPPFVTEQTPPGVHQMWYTPLGAGRARERRRIIQALYQENPPGGDCPHTQPRRLCSDPPPPVDPNPMPPPRRQDGELHPATPSQKVTPEYNPARDWRHDCARAHQPPRSFRNASEERKGSPAPTPHHPQNDGETPHHFASTPPGFRTSPQFNYSPCRGPTKKD